jgi:glutamyl-tRNA reductase
VLQPEGPYKVTIVNRQYHKGRHMVNSLEIAQKIEEMPEVQSTRSAMLLLPLSLDPVNKQLLSLYT